MPVFLVLKCTKEIVYIHAEWVPQVRSFPFAIQKNEEKRTTEHHSCSSSHHQLLVCSIVILYVRICLLLLPVDVYE